MSTGLERALCVTVCTLRPGARPSPTAPTCSPCWLDMAGEVEVVDESGASKASLVTIVMTTMNTLGVHPAADRQQM